jgi:hypothetical protein
MGKLDGMIAVVAGGRVLRQGALHGVVTAPYPQGRG